jgi:acyl carrier protein phosphodiesterase
MRRAFAEKRPALQEARQQYLVEFDRVRQAISGVPFDRDAFEDAITHLHLTREAERSLFGDIMRDVIPRLSPQGRQAFVATHMGGRP